MSFESILIVEDEAIISLAIESELELIGYSVVGRAFDGEEALRLVEQFQPDLVLMDVNLKGKIDGIETAQKLRTLHDVPIVFLTAAIDDSTVQRAINTNSYGYILKPFDQNDLRITISNALNKYQLEQQIRQSESRYRELFETSLDGIVITDLEGKILDSNLAFQKLLGYNSDQLKTMDVTQPTPQENGLDEGRMIEEQVLVRGYSDTIYKEYLHQNGTRVPTNVQILVRKSIDGKPIGLWAIIRDVSKEKIAEKKIARQTEFSQQLVKFTALLNAQVDLTQILDIICTEIIQTVAFDAAQVTLYDPQKEKLVIKHVHSSRDFSSPIRKPYPISIHKHYFPDDKTYLVLPDVQDSLKEHPNYPFFVQQNIRSVVTLKLIRKSQLIGTLDLATIGKTHRFDADEITFLETYANHAAVAIDRAILYQQTQLRTEELEAINRLSSELRMVVSRTEMLPILLTEAIRLTQADIGLIYLLGEGGNPISSLQIPITNENSVEWFSPATRLWAEALFSEGLIEDLLPESQTENETLSLESRLRLRVVVPFRSTNTLTAILVLGFTKTNMVSDPNKKALMGLAEMGGNALHRSGLMETLEQRIYDRTRDLNTLYDLTLLANSPIGISQIFSDTMQKVMDTIGASCGIISQYEEEQSLLRIKTKINMPDDFQKGFDLIPLTPEIKSWLKKSTFPWLARKGDGQMIPLHLPAGVDFDTIINLSIRFEGKTLGLLTVIWFDESDLTAENIALLRAVAERLGSALENEHLHQISEHAAVLEERHRLARELHDSVTQSLYSLTLLAEAGADLLAQQDTIRLQKCLDDLSKNSIQALKEMRMLLFELRPPHLEKQNLIKALQNRLDAIERRAGILVTLEADEDIVFDSAMQEELYWVTSEALNNSLKHSAASKVQICFQMVENYLQLTISDNGKGFDICDINRGGMGLNTMRERIERLGGAFEFWSNPGEGTRIIIRISNPEK